MPNLTISNAIRRIQGDRRAVLLKEPPLDGLPADTSPGIRRLVRRCLAKDAQQWLRDIGEAFSSTSAMGTI